MKVVFLRSNPVDPDPRVEKEVNSLLKEKYSINIVAWDRDNKYAMHTEKKQFSNGQCDITTFGILSTFGSGFKKNLLPLIKFQYYLLKWLIKNRKKYDIIHACDFDTVLPAYICKIIFGKKYVYDIFDYYVDAYSVPGILKKIIQSVDHIMINNSEATILCTEKRIEQIKGANPKKVEIIHNSPEKSELVNSNTFNLNKNKTKIVYVGILNDGRYILEIANLIKDMPECEFHIGGFGKLQNEIEELSQKYENIFFYGKLQYQLTLELESKCDVMTAIYDPNISNHYYAAPNKFYEALMLGKPLIMVKNTGMDQVIVENKIGEVAEYDGLAIQKAIENIILKKRMWTEISNKEKNIYEEEYSWERMEKRLCYLYKNI